MLSLPLRGMVLESSGSSKDGRYPLISKMIAAGFYHPRCKDSHTTYFKGINTSSDDKYTKEELDEIVENYRREQQVGYASGRHRSLGGCRNIL